MENLKIKVNSESESKEAQELFFELDYNWFKKGYVEVKTPETIMSFENGALSTGIRGSINHKEITLPELRDLVVLKRNSIDDATHKGSITDNVYYVSSDEEVYRFESSAWCFSTVIVADLKPIEKKEMKEYLMVLNEVYILVENDRKLESHWIEIPKGAQVYAVNNGYYYFFSSAGIGFEWSILWQRYTHPEELPFIDDEPKEYLRDDGNGSYILELTCKQEVTEPHAKHWIEVPVGVNFYYSFASGDKFFTKEHSSLGRLLWQRKPPFSINNQYAEIEKVRQSHRTASETADPTIKETLSQRQEQYGSFEDVAMITEQMVDVMRKGYYENLAYNQKMALYMICSKMARIVNGDPNHKDSWHDIAGYATLIDNELESEKDMPF